MSNSIFAAVVVLCGAVVGCLCYGAVFGLISASILEPSVQRAVLFGMTFGVAAGAIIAMFFVDDESGRSFAAKLLPRLTGFAFVVIAANALFREGAWDVVFEGSRGLAMATTLIWVAATVWLTKELPVKTTVRRERFL
jgi:uncharacterized protein involved in response to NO